jgi:hypothetical protein
MVEINKQKDSFVEEWARDFHSKTTAPLDSQDKRNEFAAALGITV